MKVFETDPLTSSTKKVYSTIYLTVLTRRKAGWFVANIFVPTFLMLVVSWLTFIYEPHGENTALHCIYLGHVITLEAIITPPQFKKSVELTSAILHQFYLYCSLA
jgi:hypothetical protein